MTKPFSNKLKRTTDNTFKSAEESGLILAGFPRKSHSQSSTCSTYLGALFIFFQDYYGKDETLDIFVYLDIWVKAMIEKNDCPNPWAILTSESLRS